MYALHSVIDRQFLGDFSPHQSKQAGFAERQSCGFAGAPSGGMRLKHEPQTPDIEAVLDLNLMGTEVGCGSLCEMHYSFMLSLMKCCLALYCHLVKECKE